MATHHLQLPVGPDTVASLEIGDTVYLSGTLYTGRDMAHLKLKALLAEGKPVPIDLAGGAIFHAGPVARRKGDEWELVVIGPTTSIRMEPYAEMMGSLGVSLLIGKGGMAASSSAAFKKYKQAYLQAAPGCAVLLASRVKRISSPLWLEAGMPEAMWKLEVEEFGPFVVTMDTQGNSRYDEVRANAQEVLDKLHG